MKFTICVPTKERSEILMKWFSYHYNPQFHYCISIEEQDWELYEEVRKKFSDGVYYLKIKDDRGLSYTMNRLCKYTRTSGDDFVLISADNARFDINGVVEFMEIISTIEFIIWLGAYQSHYKRFYAKKMKKGDLLVQSYLAGAVFALRLSYWEKEPFDEKVTVYEDGEYWLRIIKNFYPKVPIYFYVPFEARKTRHRPGGATKLKVDRKRILEETEYINKKFGYKAISIRGDKYNTPVRYWARYRNFLKKIKEEQSANKECKTW